MSNAHPLNERVVKMTTQQYCPEKKYSYFKPEIDPEQKLTTAQALRLADKFGIPEIRGKYIEAFLSKWPGEKMPCCAIGAAALVCGTRPKIEDGAVINGKDFQDVNSSDWHKLKYIEKVHPVYSCSCSLGYTIMNLFDKHKWTRTAIADWIEEQIK